MFATGNNLTFVGDMTRRAIRATLDTYPNPTQEANDVAAVLTWIGANGWPVDRKDRTTALVNSMYQAYQGDTRQLERARLQERLDAQIALRDRLV